MKLCWLCNGFLQKVWAEVSFPSGATVKVHKACLKDAENLIHHGKVTLHDEEMFPGEEMKKA